MRAKKMLDVAQKALDMLQDTDDKSQIEVLWIAAITSLRAVGHVLHNVDSCEKIAQKGAIDNWWKQLKNSKESEENRIYFDFIEVERNDTLKEFAIHYDENLNDLLILENGDDVYRINELTDQLLYIPMTEGFFEGEDIRDLLALGIEWWKLQFVKMGL